MENCTKKILSLAETPAGVTDGAPGRAAVDAGVRLARAYARRANSEDSIEVLSTTESIFPDDLTAITEEEADHQPQSNGLDKEADVLTEDESQRVGKEKTLNETASGHEDESEEEDGRLDTDESLNQNTLDGEVVMKEEQVLKFLKNSRVDEDKPVETLQGNTSDKMFIFRGLIWVLFSSVVVCPHLKVFIHFKKPDIVRLSHMGHSTITCFKTGICTRKTLFQM